VAISNLIISGLTVRLKWGKMGDIMTEGKF